MTASVVKHDAVNGKSPALNLPAWLKAPTQYSCISLASISFMFAVWVFVTETGPANELELTLDDATRMMRGTEMVSCDK